jgi:hypothetical protein
VESGLILQVFISWSGNQSHAVALAVREWLPKVLAGKVKPFVSSEDIDKGSRGLDRIANELRESRFGVVVVTPENQVSTWVAFEAGALGKSMDTARVSPLLVGMTDADVVGPLKQFQNAAAADLDQVRALVKSINKVLDADALPETTVDDLFDLHWPKLEEKIADALRLNPEQPTQPRGETDLLDEVLTTVRALQRDVSDLRRVVDGQLRTSNTTWAFPRRDRHITLQEIFDQLGTGSYSMIRVGDRAVVDLSSDMPTLGPDTLAAVQSWARNEPATVTIKRADGSTLSYDADGQETRTAATAASILDSEAADS